MVSLFEILSQSSGFLHLSTSIPTLDSYLLGNITNGIYEFQTVPNCNAPYAIGVSLIVSHLKKESENMVYIVDCLNRYPFKLLEQHPDFDKIWYDTQMVSYTCDTFGKLFKLFASGKMNCQRGKGLVIINNFHELVEMYKLELAATYKELLLKFQIQRNAILINNMEQLKEEGIKATLPELPLQSDLLKVVPSQKFQTHLNSLINMISQFTYKNESICLLIGYLDIKYEKYRPKMSYVESSQVTATRSSSPSSSSRPSSSKFSNSLPNTGRLVLSPSLGEINASPTSSFKARGSLLDSFVLTRIIFLKDWYHNSPHYKASMNSITTKCKKLKMDRLRTVFVAKVVNTQVQGSLSPLVYFDYDNEFYDNTLSNAPMCNYIKLIDLSGPANLAATMVPGTQKTSNTNVGDPKIEDSNNNRVNETLISDESQEVALPSSPNLTESQIRIFLPDNSTSHTSVMDPILVETRNIFSDNSVVEESDEDIMGSLLIPNGTDSHG